MFDVTVIGGGAFGVLAALQTYKSKPHCTIAIFEKRKQVLLNCRADDLFRVGGNVYSKDDILEQIQTSDIELYKSSEVQSLETFRPHVNGKTAYRIKTRRGTYASKNLIVACGQEPSFLRMLGSIGFDVKAFRPAAFNMVCKDPRLKRIKVQNLEVSLSWVKSGPPRKRIRIQLASTLPESQPLKQVNGPISLHSGTMMGKAVRELTSHILDVQETPPDRIRICVNWLPEYGLYGLLDYLQMVGRLEGKKTVMRSQIFPLPGALWRSLAAAADIAKQTSWDDMRYEQYYDFAAQLHDSHFGMKPDLSAKGIPYFKGGVRLTNLRSGKPESQEYPGMFFIGPILDQEQQFRQDSVLELNGHDITWLSEIGKGS